jgi:hypothetical protein
MAVGLTGGAAANGQKSVAAGNARLRFFISWPSGTALSASAGSDPFVRPGFSRASETAI